MALSLNVPTAPAAFYTISIEQRTYQLKFRWQSRGRCWYFSMQDKDGIVICRNVKLVPNMNLIRQNKTLAPEGTLMVVKRTNDSIQIPGRKNIGPNKDFELMYYSVAEGG